MIPSFALPFSSSPERFKAALDRIDNHSDTERVHLVIDRVDDDWLGAIFGSVSPSTNSIARATSLPRQVKTASYRSPSRSGPSGTMNNSNSPSSSCASR
jgi:hypothetical protein